MHHCFFLYNFISIHYIHKIKQVLSKFLWHDSLPADCRAPRWWQVAAAEQCGISIAWFYPSVVALPCCESFVCDWARPDCPVPPSWKNVNQIKHTYYACTHADLSPDSIIHHLSHQYASSVINAIWSAESEAAGNQSSQQPKQLNEHCFTLTVTCMHGIHHTHTHTHTHTLKSPKTAT